MARVVVDEKSIKSSKSVGEKSDCLGVWTSWRLNFVSGSTGSVDAQRFSAQTLHLCIRKLLKYSGSEFSHLLDGFSQPLGNISNFLTTLGSSIGSTSYTMSAQWDGERSIDCPHMNSTARPPPHSYHSDPRENNRRSFRIFTPMANASRQITGGKTRSINPCPRCSCPSRSPSPPGVSSVLHRVGPFICVSY